MARFTQRKFTLASNGIRSTTDGGRGSEAAALKMARPEMAFMDMNSGGGFGGPQAFGYFAAGTQTKTFDAMLPENSEETLIPFYRDIYYYDSVGGSACDMTSSFAFSDWTLSGVEPDRAKVYSEGLARLNMRTLLNEIALHYMVDGDFIGTLIYNPDIKNFQDILIHDRLQCRVVPSPFYSMDPIIQAHTSQKLRVFQSMNSKYGAKALKNYPQDLINDLSSGIVDLNPLTTLHVARRSLADRMSGSVSYLKRVLPVYLLEKTLYRGSLVEFNKRLRATSHIQVGEDTWVPTTQEMQDILHQFQSTEVDPLGAWIVTRQGVQVQDIRQGGEFARWTDYLDQFVNVKLRALCISEAFLAGDASYATADTALTSFMENLDAFRNYITFRTFNYKIFPIIAMANGFYKKGEEPKKGASIEDLLFDLNNHKGLDIPKVVYNKDLTNQEGQSRVEMLNMLSEKGMPIALRTYAAASGLDIGTLMSDLAEETKDDFHRLLQEYKAKMGSISNEEGNGEDNYSFGSVNGHRTIPKPLRKKALLSRTFKDPEPYTLSRTGKKKAVLSGDHKFMKKENEVLAKAMERLQDKEYRHQVKKQIIAKRGAIPKIL